MKINSTVALTLVLLTLMLGAGYMSAIWGFTVGHQALKGVTQPDVRPTSNIRFRKGKSQQRAVVILKEEDILATVKARISSKGKNVKPQKPQPESKESSSKQTPAQKTQSVATDVTQPGFPITSRDRGVTLEVLSTRYAGGALLLKVNFKNESSKNVRFLYSFLDVTDDQGRALSANTEGLPGELPPNGNTFSGTVSIPTALLDNVRKLSLTLTDYPEQQLLLQLSDIPVKR